MLLSPNEGSGGSNTFSDVLLSNYLHNNIDNNNTYTDINNNNNDDVVDNNVVNTPQNIVQDIFPVNNNDESKTYNVNEIDFFKNISPSNNIEERTDVNCNMCHICEIEHEKDLDSTWVNCNRRNCDYWVHVVCVGIDISDKWLKNLKYFCPTHNAVRVTAARKRLFKKK
ncbi:probable basic-leucine zipper transcription factor S [Hydractinia symbiolongicarpus]|uniref:probable basic-leucine zipper transcription factor S n=1 Tax=Hydractinia symbiolongicarpus TaxID=13093 RepID=UPI00254BA64E|nr:probable basic-leucine zipper transcription factor S [Hydractinia symbiolongicarpus]